MFITKCDICKKVIKDGDEVSVRYEPVYHNYHFCSRCGKPVIDFMKKQGLFEGFE